MQTIFSQFETSFTPETTFATVVMDQHLERNYTSESNDIVREQMKQKERPNKCNQCKYSSSYASVLRRHFKMHSGEKSNKCNQYDYPSSQAGHLRTHMKNTVGKRRTNENRVILYPLMQAL